jgi:tRNA U34 5-carboxymethylaminomethyl modifying GTPase MnmE/TrmE
MRRVSVPHPQDPIAAIATAPGRGAVGIVRVSGCGIAPLLVVNKLDLDLPSDDLAYIEAYKKLGLAVVRVSARTRAGFEDLIERMRGKRKNQ